MDGRHTLTSDERQEVEAISKTLKVSSYLDDVFEAIHTGAPPKVKVPNYRQPTKGEVLASVHSNTPLRSESEGMSMDFEGLYKMGMEDTMLESHSSYPSPSVPPAPGPPRQSITQNQWNAIKKYPGLVEFLGQAHGEKVARQISEQVNVTLAEVIQNNSHEANEHAVACKADRQNLKQYFQADDWICRVTASGPFIGDDAIYYSRKQDLACVLRKVGSGDSVKYADVSSKFNIIFEASIVEKQNESVAKESNNEENNDPTANSN